MLIFRSLMSARGWTGSRRLAGMRPGAELQRVAVHHRDHEFDRGRPALHHLGDQFLGAEHPSVVVLWIRTFWLNHAVGPCFAWRRHIQTARSRPMLTSTSRVVLGQNTHTGAALP